MVLPGRVVAEQKLFFITLGGLTAHDSSVEKHFHEETAEPRISPLRFASVEMTKGRVVLPGRVVAEQKLFFITLGGLTAHDSSVEKHFHDETAEPQAPPLRFAPVGMTKGRVVLPGRVVAEQKLFSSPWVGSRPMTPLSKNISTKRPLNRRSLHCAALRSR